MRLFGDIARRNHSVPTGLAYDPRGLLGIGVLVQVGDEDVGTLTREGQRHRTTDAAVTAGDERHFSLQAAMPLVRLLAVIGTGGHLRFETWVLQAVLREWRLGPGFAGVLHRRARGHRGLLRVCAK